MGLNCVHFQGLPGLGSLRLLVATSLSSNFQQNFPRAVGQVVAIDVAVAVDRDDLEQIQFNLNLGDLG